jgi:hypothetical protein
VRWSCACPQGVSAPATNDTRAKEAGSTRWTRPQLSDADVSPSLLCRLYTELTIPTPTLIVAPACTKTTTIIAVLRDTTNLAAALLGFAEPDRARRRRTTESTPSETAVSWRWGVSVPRATAADRRAGFPGRWRKCSGRRGVGGVQPARGSVDRGARPRRRLLRRRRKLVTAPAKPRNDVLIADVVSMYMWKRNSPHRTPHVVVSGDGWHATPRRGS